MNFDGRECSRVCLYSLPKPALRILLTIIRHLTFNTSISTSISGLVAEVVGPRCGVGFAVCLEGDGLEVEAYVADGGVDAQGVENA